MSNRWVDVEHPEVVDIVRKIVDDPNEVPWVVEYAMDLLDSDIYDDLSCHVRGSPLFELSSIKISNHLFQTIDMEEGSFGRSCAIEVYGHIRLIDDKGNMFTLFKLDYENAKQVILDDRSDGLSVILRKPQLGLPRCLPQNLKLHILLKDRIRDVVFFDGCKFLDFSCDICYDSVMCCTLNYNVERNSHRLESSIEIGFTVFHCAVLASLSFTLLGVGNDDINLNVKLRASIKLGDSEVCHELFDDEPSILEFGAPNELCVLAVPVYSPLKIVATILSDDDDDRDKIIVRELEFNPMDGSGERIEKNIHGQNCQMLVSVTWDAALYKLPENYLREWDPTSSDIKQTKLACASSSESEIDSEIELGDCFEKPLHEKPFSSKFETKLACSSSGESDSEIEQVDSFGKPPWENPFPSKSETKLAHSSSSDNDSEIEQADGFEMPPRKKPFPSKFETTLARSSSNKRKIYQKRPEHMEHLNNMKRIEKTSDKNGYFIQPELQQLRGRRWLVTRWRNEFVELFCVSICSFDNNDGGASSITGRIDCRGSFSTRMDYFSEKDFKTGILYPHVTEECLMGPNFHMEFDLNDAEGHQISHGYVDYNDENVASLYDRRVCSVVVGRCGYAAAYYTIFRDAQQARLKIRLLPDNGAVVRLQGTIHARYDNFNYSTEYYRDYFQSVIFEKGKLESVKGGSEVPLTKSAVAVPFNGSLIVGADLCVVLDDKPVETLKGKATFNPRNQNDEDFEELKIISGSSTFHLSVNVIWGYPEFLHKNKVLE